MQLYKVGDVCVGRGFDVEGIYSEFNNLECTIIKPLGLYTFLNGEIEFAYHVEWANKSCLNYVAQKHLKLKRPPDEKSSWDEFEKITGFNPIKENV